MIAHLRKEGFPQTKTTTFFKMAVTYYQKNLTLYSIVDRLGRR
jgi:hypothetical protein